MQSIEKHESNVRSYVRNFPTVFSRAEGSHLYDAAGREYIDFFAGAGALNYGHNNPHMKRALIEYIESGGVTHSLDMATEAKARFLETFDELILAPRNMNYKVMFPGPTGTNAVEAALKLARKITGRMNVVSFTNAFHGMTLGSLTVTGNEMKRNGAGVPLSMTTRLPFDGYLGDDVDTLDQFEAMLDDSSSGLDQPAAIIIETIQAEGGINVAGFSWLRRLERIARKHGIVFIVDDIQVGNGRTGPFFSFEEIGLLPDIVCLSKSLSGYGTPFAATLIQPHLDVWDPGEHNGTFRGNNHAFVTSRAALETYWRDDTLTNDVKRKTSYVAERLAALAEKYDGEARGRGFIRGIAFENPHLAGAASAEGFKRGIIMETSGAKGEVLKFLAPLTIDDTTLEQGLDIVARSVEAAATSSVEGKLEADELPTGANGVASRLNGDSQLYARYGAE
ncbi:MAG: diaminobutyrate--2-oxoglutarate transaminase [Deltaproteobacteria bacterium]|nr:diaminobutyrate--2-oxoglutarate transaminase [Deltaproteobacteria bacterium]MCB9488067.1 diaminobutyrate--2-oxoglutarate transaminase [Deltaproteobacteria bacterium]